MVGASSDSKRSTTIQFPPFPGVADFGSQFESGVDYSEGIFMQSIYPRFGVGEEFNALAHFDRGTKRSNGLGKYGLAGDDAVHLTETSHSALIKDENQLSVLNSWGYYWGEKSIRSGNSSVDVEFPTRVLLNWLTQVLADSLTRLHACILIYTDIRANSPAYLRTHSLTDVTCARSRAGPASSRCPGGAPVS